MSVSVCESNFSALFPLFLICGCAQPFSVEIKPPKQGYLSYHSIPLECADFCSTGTCIDGYCRSGGGKIITINYTATSSSQLGGGCYHYGKFHTFQTLNAYLLNIGYGTDRSIRLAMGTYFQCAPELYMENFIQQVGLVEFCYSPYTTYPFDTSECKYCTKFRSFSSPPENCSELQLTSNFPLLYRASGYVITHLPQGREERKDRLAELLETYGPIVANTIWSLSDRKVVSEPEYELADGLEIRELTCGGQSLPEGHTISVVGYDFRGERPYFYIQNSHGVGNGIEKLDYYDWYDGCHFGYGEISYFTGVEKPTNFQDKKMAEFCRDTVEVKP